LLAVIAFAATLFVMVACGRAMQPAPMLASASPADRDLARLRDATRPFRDLDSAVAAGYPRTVTDCIIHEHHGAMGYHHLNRDLADGVVDVEHPEMLLYERLPNGVYRLNGVEFIVPYRFWSRDSTPPEVLGQRMKHEDNFKYWYMHVWAWRPNRDGLFADFNPDVQCPASASKVYHSPSEPAE